MLALPQVNSKGAARIPAPHEFAHRNQSTETMVLAVP